MNWTILFAELALIGMVITTFKIMSIVSEYQYPDWRRHRRLMRYGRYLQLVMYFALGFGLPWALGLPIGDNLVIYLIAASVVVVGGGVWVYQVIDLWSSRIINPSFDEIITIYESKENHS